MVMVEFWWQTDQAVVLHAQIQGQNILSATSQPNLLPTPRPHHFSLVLGLLPGPNYPSRLRWRLRSGST